MRSRARRLSTVHDDAVRSALCRVRPEYTLFRGVMASWDNTARRGLRANVYHHATPQEYESWLRQQQQQIQSANQQVTQLRKTLQQNGNL